MKPVAEYFQFRSFYQNIVCQNYMCDEGLKDIFVVVKLKTHRSKLFEVVPTYLTEGHEVVVDVQSKQSAEGMN
jgi:hypothetical protein